MLQPGSCLPEPLDQLTANTLTNITQRIADAPTRRRVFHFQVGLTVQGVMLSSRSIWREARSRFGQA